MRQITKFVAIAAMVVFGVNCGGGSEPNDPEPGNLTVALTATPNNDDAAIKLRIIAPVAPSAITAAAGLQVFLNGPIGTSTTVVVTGDMTAGPLLTLTVPDTRKADDYSASVLQVASTTYALRGVTGYALTVDK